MLLTIFLAFPRGKETLFIDLAVKQEGKNAGKIQTTFKAIKSIAFFLDIFSLVFRHGGFYEHQIK